MCLILKVDQPLFFLAVYLNRYYDRTCIDLITFFLILKLSLLLQLTHTHKSQIHQTDKFVISAFKQCFMSSLILIVCLLDYRTIISFLKCNVL